MLSKERFNEMIRRYDQDNKKSLLLDIDRRIKIEKKEKTILRLVPSNQVTGIENLIITNNIEFKKFEKEIDRYYGLFQEIWMIVIEQKNHYMGRIILDFETGERILEISRGKNAKVLNNIENSTSYLRYCSQPFLKALYIRKKKNTDANMIKNANRIRRLLINYEGRFHDLEILLVRENVSSICLQFRLEEDMTLSFYDWDGDYNKVIRVLDNINALL